MSVTTPLRLDTTACNRCGRCAPSCASKALRIGPGYIYVDWARCTACGKCAELCDTGAIVVRQAAGVGLEERAPMVTARDEPAQATVRSWWARGAHAATKPAAAKPSTATTATAKTAPVRAAAKPSASASSADPAHASTSGIAWTLPEGTLVLVVAFALLMGAQALLSSISGTGAWAAVATLVYDAALAGLLLYLARRHGATSLAAFRLDVAPEWSSALLSVAVAAGCWLFSVTYRASVLAIGLRPPASEGTDLTALFGTGVVGVVLTVALVAFVGPVLEEALLRGVVLDSVRHRFGPWAAIVASAVAFALLHASLWSLLPLTVLGIGLGWLAVRSRSLWPAIIAHVLYNAVLVMAALYTAAR